MMTDPEDFFLPHNDIPDYTKNIKDKANAHVTHLVGSLPRCTATAGI